MSRLRDILSNKEELETLFGWITVTSAGLLLGSGAAYALWHNLPSRWAQLAATVIFAIAQAGTARKKRSPIARALASIVYVAAVLEAYWFSWGLEDATVFAWSNLSVAAVRDGLLLWGLGLGALVLTLAPPQPSTRLMGGLLGLFLMLPWIWGLAQGADRFQILQGPDWMAWGWFIQPAFLGLLLLLPTALYALIETAYKTRGHGAMEHGVLLGLGLLSIAPIGLITLHQVTPDLVKRAPQVAQTSELDLAVHSEAAPSHASHAHSAHAAKPPAGLDESRETEESSLPRFDCSDVVLPEAPIGSIRVNFREEHWGRSALALLEQRFPDGAWLVQSLEDPDHLERAFSQPPEDWDGLVSGLSTAMHNMVQLVGFQDLGERVYAYPVSETVTLRTDRVQTFPRASILEHIPVVLRDMRITESYLRGQSSSQSFESLLDELNAYTWSLYVEIALKDQHINREVAARDAVLAMLLYTDSYLHQARTKVPEVHARIVENQALLQAVITLWDRAVCVIDLSGSDPRLGIQDLALGPLVFDRETPLEVEELRGQIDPPAEAEAKPPGEPPETSAEEQQAAAPEGAADSQPGEEK